MYLTQEEVTPSFAGHETFTLRYGWLKKAINGAAEDAQLFSRPDAMVQLGVGKNMVRSMRHWAMATGILEEDPTVPNNRGRRLRPSALGEWLFGDGGLDPYLERLGTIWLLHYLLASTPDGPTTWYWAFNCVSDLEFTTTGLVNELEQLAEARNWNRVAATTLQRDVSCFIRTYVPPKRTRTVGSEDTLDCPLNELGLISSLDSVETYAFSRGAHRSLPNDVFAFALLHFWKRIAPQSNSLSSSDIAFEFGSPGKVFKLTESAVVDYMRDMDKITRNAIVFDSTAGLIQVYRRKEIQPLDVLRLRKTGDRK